MKNRTTFAIAAIALSLGTSLQAAPDSHGKDRGKHAAATRQIDNGFGAIEKAVADARKQANEAIEQRDAALKSMQDEKAATEKSRKDAETKAAATAKAKEEADMSARKRLEASLNDANRKLAIATKQIADLSNQVKASEASKQKTEKQLAETKQKLDQALNALTVQLKTIADARNRAAASEKKQAEAPKHRDAEHNKPREEEKARKDRNLPKKGN